MNGYWLAFSALQLLGFWVFCAYFGEAIVDLAWYWIQREDKQNGDDYHGDN